MSRVPPDPLHLDRFFCNVLLYIPRIMASSANRQKLLREKNLGSIRVAGGYIWPFTLVNNIRLRSKNLRLARVQTWDVEGHIK